MVDAAVADIDMDIAGYKKRYIDRLWDDIFRDQPLA